MTRPRRGFRLLPDVFIGHFAVALDGGTLLLVLLPAGALTRPVAVLRKPALPAALQLLLTPEAAVADPGRVTGPTTTDIGHSERS